MKRKSFMKRKHDTDTSSNYSSMYLECTKGTSSNFWSCTIDDAKKTVISYGKVGNTGRRLVKEHSSADAAEKYIAKRSQEKLRNGYSLTAKPEDVVREDGNPRKRVNRTKAAKTATARGARKPEIIEVRKRVGTLDPQAAASLRGPLLAETKKGNVKKVRQLLQQGADPNTITNQSNRWMPLHFASEMGHTAVGRVLLEYGATVNARSMTSKHVAPLDVAVMWSQKEMTQLLVDNGASVHEPTPAGRRLTPLHRAAEAGHTEMVSLLIDNGASLTATDKHGDRPLERAALRNRMETVKQLIQLGGCVNTTKNQSRTLLSRVAAEVRSEEMVQLLIEHGALVNATDKDGRTPLMAVARSRKNCMWMLGLLYTTLSTRMDDCRLESVAKLLIEKGGSVTITRKGGFTALHDAALEGGTNPGVIRQLIDHGGDVNATSDNGCTPLCMMSLQRGGVADRREAVGVAKCLVEYGGASLTEKFLSLFKKRPDGKTTTTMLLGLTSASVDLGWQQWPYLVQAMVDSDPSGVHATDTDGRTPLHMTASSHLARALIEKGASVDAKETANGQTALSEMWLNSHDWDSCLIPCSIMAVRLPTETRPDAAPQALLSRRPPRRVHLWNFLTPSSIRGLVCEKLKMDLGDRARGGGVRAQYAMLRNLCLSRIV